MLVESCSHKGFARSALAGAPVSQPAGAAALAVAGDAALALARAGALTAPSPAQPPVQTLDAQAPQSVAGPAAGQAILALLPHLPLAELGGPIAVGPSCGLPADNHPLPLPDKSYFDPQTQAA